MSHLTELSQQILYIFQSPFPYVVLETKSDMCLLIYSIACPPCWYYLSFVLIKLGVWVALSDTRSHQVAYKSFIWFINSKRGTQRHRHAFIISIFRKEFILVYKLHNLIANRATTKPDETWQLPVLSSDWLIRQTSVKYRLSSCVNFAVLFLCGSNRTFFSPCVSVGIEASQCSYPVESCLALLLGASLLIILRWSRRLQFVCVCVCVCVCVTHTPLELRFEQTFQFALLADINTIDKVLFVRVGENLFINRP